MSLNAAVVGVGHLGEIHARILKELPDVNLKNIVDINKARAREVGEKHDVEPVFDHRETLKQDLDMAVISVPTRDHFRVAKDFIEAGISVLVEKPMTREFEQAWNLHNLAKQNNVILQVGHVERFNPAVQELIKRVEKPKFIECDRLSPFRFRSADIDVVLDVMIHDLDIILSVVPGEIVSVDSVATSVITPLEDIAHVRLCFSSGCIVNLSASRISMDSTRKLRVFTPDAYYSLDYQNQQLQIFSGSPKLDTLTMEDLEELRQKESQGEIDTEKVFLNLLEIEEAVSEEQKKEPLRLELEAFLEAVNNDEQPPASGEEGVKAMRLADRIKKCWTTSP